VEDELNMKSRGERKQGMLLHVHCGEEDVFVLTLSDKKLERRTVLLYSDLVRWIGGKKDLSPTVLKISEEGCRFRSYRDGTKVLLTPETSVQAQKAYRWEAASFLWTVQWILQRSKFGSRNHKAVLMPHHTPTGGALKPP
jgi:hypothetical protein